MAKDKTKVKDKAKAKAKAKDSGAPTEYLVNSKQLLATMTTMKKMLGDHENIDLSFSDGDVFVTAQTGKGTLSLKAPSAVIEGKGSFSFQVPYIMMVSAMQGRGDVSITKSKSDVTIRSGRYSAELHCFESTVKIKKSNVEAIPSDAVSALAENAGGFLTMSNFIENTKLDVLLKWSAGEVYATQIDNYHGVVVVGKIDNTKISGELTLPRELFFNLAELGGELGFKDNMICVASDKGLAELAQVDTENSPVSLKSALDIFSRKEAGRITVDGEEFSNLLDNVINVTEADKSLTVEVKDKGKKKILYMSCTGRFGRVKGEIDISEHTGKVPSSFNVSPNAIADVQSIMDGVVDISFLGNVIKVTPKEKKDWQATAFVVLLSGA